MILAAVFRSLSSHSCSGPRLHLLLTLWLLLLSVVSPLHLLATQDPKEYNEDTYYSELSGMQQRFSNDLNSINDKFRAINMQLADTNVSATDKVILLQENLAD